MNSRASFAGKSLFTHRISGALATRDTGAKLFTGSNGSLPA